MSRRARLVLGLGSLAALGALLLWAVGGLPDFGHPRGPYADLAPKIMLNERHVTNAVTGVTFDLRGFDTLGEELILFASVIAVALLLRELKDEDRPRPRQSFGGDGVRAVGFGLVGPTVVLGLYVALHGYLTPGGGFQGGVVVASAFVLVYLAGEYHGYRRLTPIPAIDFVGGSGAGGYAVIGIVSLLLGTSYLHNFGPLGTSGTLASGGSIPFLNVASALEVSAAFVLLFTEFLDELSTARAGRAQ